MKMRDVVVQVADRHQLDVDAILGTSAKRTISRARDEAWWRLRQMQWGHGGYRYSLPQIAGLFGKHHTTVMKGIQRHERRLAEARARVGAT